MVLGSTAQGQDGAGVSRTRGGWCWCQQYKGRMVLGSAAQGQDGAGVSSTRAGWWLCQQHKGRVSAAQGEDGGTLSVHYHTKRATKPFNGVLHSQTESDSGSGHYDLVLVTFN